MNRQQQRAMKQHCRLACETARPLFNIRNAELSVTLTVNSGYE